MFHIVDDIVEAIAAFLIEQKFEIHYTAGHSSIAVFPSRAISIWVIIWFNPEVSVTVSSYRTVGIPITLNDPRSFDTIARAINALAEKEESL